MKRRFFLSATAAAPVVASAPAVSAPMVEMSAADIAPVAPIAQTFTASASYILPGGVKYVTVRVTAGSGGGGSA